MTKILSLLKRSLKGEGHDYTQGSIPEAVILLAIPMILELGLEGVFAVVDMFFVSKLGPSAIATVGLTESVVTIVYSIAIGLSTGATAMIARRVGEKNFELASHAGAQSLVLSGVVSLVIAAAGAVYAKEILMAMGAAPDVVRDGTIFAQILLGGSTAIVLLFVINGVFRGAGDAAMAMRSLWIASGTNILLCPILIHFFGLKGAAMATLLGRSTGVAYQCFHLAKGDGVLKIRKAHFSFDFPIVKSIAAIGWPASLQYVIGSGSWIILTRLVAETGGTPASAGYQIAFRNFVFFILPAWGLSNAAATLVGQNLGAKNYQRAEESALLTAKYNTWFMSVVTVIFVGLAPWVVSIYTSDPAVTANAIGAMRGIGIGFVFYGIGMVMSQALNGAGATRTPTWINFICFWVFQTPFAYFLAKKTSIGAQGVIIAIPAAHALLAVTAWIIFKRGKWKEVKI